jgi:hypothetical protein
MTDITEKEPDSSTLLGVAESKWKNAVEKFTDSTGDAIVNSKLAGSVKEFSDDPVVIKKIFDLVDERVKQSADQVREEIKMTMAEVRIEQRRSLYINIATVVFAVVAVLINKLF